MPSATELRKHHIHRSRNLMVEAISDAGGDQCEPFQPQAIADEHPSMEVIRESLRLYQLQSPGRSELGLEVHQIADTSHSNEKINATARIIDVQFLGYTAEGHISILCKCWVALRKYGSVAEPWTCIAITEDQNIQVLEHFLSSNFPILDAPLRKDTLWSWWMSNDKKFNWVDLPTELKERIVEFCMHQPHGFGIYREKLTRYDRRYKPDFKIKKVGPYEIVDQLGDWYQLLSVSHQVRAITLRLCITGRSSLTHSKGLCITASSYRSFSECINRLGDYYQMIEPDSVPTTSKEEALSKCYRRFPRVYPELMRYATLRHGIRKINLGMDFRSFMTFFKVKAGDFQQCRKPRGLTYHVFERLPNLNEIIIRLPLRPRGGWKDSPRAGNIRMFHDDAPCPRTLHRIIYQRIAVALAAYSVTVCSFIDEGEKQRFASARLEAVNDLKFTKVELEELYADDGGGVELPDVMRRGAELPKSSQGMLHTEYFDDLQDQLFPPICFCDEPCILSPVLAATEHIW